MATLELPLSQLCGQLLIGGFAGPELSPRFRQALSEGRRGGAILFRRNLPDIESSARLCASIAEASPGDLPPLIGVDQEGGRVTRLPSPALSLPPMRTLGALFDLELIRAAARAVAAELSAIGFNLNFAPVLDVDSNPQNPVIGDRAFGSDPRTVMRSAIAYMQGLQEKNVLACGKHFPGHGDTSVDSHFDLPVVEHGRERLERIELPPFRAASGAGIATLMTAHLICKAYDPDVPATMSRAICGSLLRAQIGFEGVLISDDLEMAAVAARYPIEVSAVEAVWAGCDALLICKDEDLQDRAHAALVKKAEEDSRFRDRCAEAVGRLLRIRRYCPPRPITSKEALSALVGGKASREISDRIAKAIASAQPGVSG